MFCYDIKLILRKYLWVLYSVIKPEYSVSSALLGVGEKGTHCGRISGGTGRADEGRLKTQQLAGGTWACNSNSSAGAMVCGAMCHCLSHIHLFINLCGRNWRVEMYLTHSSAHSFAELLLHN